MSFVELLLLIQIFSCWFMAGVIWLVQVLVYPNFLNINSSDLTPFHDFHLKRITWVVLPAMTLELVSALGLVAVHLNFYFIFNLLTIVMLWSLTAFVNVPTHNRLAHYQETKSKLNLVRRNWPRTVIWSLRSLYWMWLILSMKIILK